MLVSRLCRSDLEELLVSYAPLLPQNKLRSDLLQRLSPTLHGREVAARKPVEGNAALVESGAFAKLDSEVCTVCAVTLLCSLTRSLIRCTSPSFRSSLSKTA